MANIKFTTEKTSTGLSAYADDFENLPIFSTGKDIKELKENLLEASNLFFDYHNMSLITIDDIELNIDGI